MTDQEIDKWVEEHLSDINDPAIRNHCIRLGQIIAHKFYKLGKSEIPINLTWQDIKKIVNIADVMLDDPKMRIAIQNHSEEEYYKMILKEFNNVED